MSKIKLYIPEPLQNMPLAPWFTTPSSGQLFVEHLPQSFFDTDIEKVSEVVQARAIVLPNNFRFVDAKAVEYIRRCADLGERAGVPVFVFSLGDFTDSLRFDPRVWVFRLSAYRSRMGPRDILMPTSTEDLGAQGIVLRKKQGAPVVSFCGMAGFSSWRGWAKYYFKLVYWDIASLFNPLVKARKIGVYWRRAAMRACRSSPLVETLFIIRRTFSGNRKAIELDPALARKEYIDSIVGADFVLAPKGDGNYSNRFLEALSLGRFPVLVDTDAALPLEGVIDYSKIIVRVPMSKVAETQRYIREFYDAMDGGEYARRQELARDVFVRYLRSDSFFRTIFAPAYLATFAQKTPTP